MTADVSQAPTVIDLDDSHWIWLLCTVQAAVNGVIFTCVHTRLQRGENYGWRRPMAPEHVGRLTPRLLGLC